MPTWGEILNEVKSQEHGTDELRKKYLLQASEITGRNTIAYYSGWLEGRSVDVEISDRDMTGFMSVLNGTDCTKGLDLILHTPGGSPTATEGIVKYLHNKFGNNVRVVVPQMAMSAGTMLACSAKEIVLGKHSCLGPIDPQYGGVSAYNIIEEFQDAKREMIATSASKTYWEMQLGRYPNAFFYSVRDAIKLSEALITEWLKEYMFYDEENGADKDKKVAQIVSKLNANNKSHSRHFDYGFCDGLGLKVKSLEDDQKFQEAILSAHHAFTITLSAMNISKIIENQNGVRYIIKQQT